MDGRYRWHLACGRDGIIREAGRQKLTSGIVDYLFVKGRPDALGDCAVNLAVDDYRIDHAAAILGDNVAIELHLVVGRHLGVGSIDLRLVQTGLD
jgi:hypothetical protein